LFVLALALPAAFSTAVHARELRVETVVDAAPEEIWRAWTTSEGAQSFFAPKANIRLAIGGPFEIYFNPADEAHSSKGMHILSYVPNEMLSFQWNAPPNMPQVRNAGMWVVVRIRPDGARRSHVQVTHLGWKDGAEWDLAYAHFQRGWTDLLDRLQRRFASGPIDWAREPMMWQEAQRPD